MNLREKKFHSFVTAKTALVAIAFLATAGTLYAWSAPIDSPAPNCTAGNPGCDAPINVSGAAQTKTGNLLLNLDGILATGLWVPFGNVGIGGVVAPTNKFYVSGGVTTRPVTIDSTGNGSGLELSRSGTAQGMAGLQGAFTGVSSSNVSLAGYAGNGVTLFTNGNSTPRLAIDTSGNVGIGTASPATKLEVITTNGDGLTLANANNNGFGGGLLFKNARGTPTVPVALVSGDYLYSVASQGYQNGAYQWTGQIRSIVDAAPVGSNVPNRFEFETKDSAGVSRLMILKSTGNLGIGMSPAAAYKLDVAGDVNVSSGSCFRVNGVCLAAGGGTVGGSGTQNYVTKWNNAGGTSIGNSQIFDNGTSIGIGTALPNAKLSIDGAGTAGNKLFVQGGINNSGDTFVINERTRNDAQNSIYVQAGAASGDFVVKTNGNVGIGTVSPSKTLDVVKLQTSGDVTTARQIRIGSDTNANYSFYLGYYYPNVGTFSGVLQPFDNGSASNLLLNPSGGNVGIGTLGPVNKLDVNGDVALTGKHAFRSNDTWLRLNQDGAFSSGVHTPGNLAPGALNVGGQSGWGNPGAGNAWITGNVGIGTAAINTRLYVAQTTDTATMSYFVRTTGAGSNTGYGFSALHAQNGPYGLITIPTNVKPAVTGVGTTCGGACLQAAGNLTPGIFGFVPGGGYGSAALAGLFKRGDTYQEVIINGGYTDGGTIYPFLVYDTGDETDGNPAPAGTLFAITQTGNVGIGMVPGAGFKLDVNGAIQATGIFYTPSDETLKKDIQTIPNALADVLKLHGVHFNWKKDGVASVGVIAQEVERVYPELVNTDPTTGIKSVGYANLVAPLIEAVRELKTENDDLRARIERLEAKN